jgi:hypothetical protein
MSVGNEESSEIDEIDASVSAQRGTEPQLSGRRLKHVDGVCRKWDTTGTKRRGLKMGEVQESAELQASTYSHLDEEVELCDSSAAVGLVSVSCPCGVSTRNPVSIVIGKIIGILRGVRAERRPQVGTSWHRAPGEAAKGKQSAKDMECVADAVSLEASSDDDEMRGEWWSVREMCNIENNAIVRVS